MAPLLLNPHSCQHCQQLIINETVRLSAQDKGEEKNFIHFNFVLLDIVTGAADSCSFCTWLLDTEWIHRSITVNEVYAKNSASADDSHRSVIDAVAEASIRQDVWMPPPNPANILRNYLAEDRMKGLDDLRLVCFFQHHMDIKFFGLWDVEKMHIVYRTRHGFSVFTQPGNPAARTISTRPIEREAGSDAIFTKVSGWLQECLHGEFRGKKIHASCPKPRDDYMPTRLIEITKIGDRVELKVKATSGSPTESYCALSYCWGGDQSIKSTKALLPKWMESIPWVDLPQTLRDAATVCQKLNIKYLWVDAFCIVQDDSDEKEVEISQMSNIYCNATLTIAASRAASVHEGFLADRSATQFLDEVFTLQYQAKRAANLGSVTLIRTQINPEPLDTRGWTLQERLLSARTLEFGSRQLRFICQHNPRGTTDGWRLKPEANAIRQDNLENIAVLQAAFNEQSSRPQATEYANAVETWYRLVAAYTHRNMTLPMDRILAISGIAERYNRILNDTYFAGLWRSTLARSLYWTARDNTQPRPTTWQGPSWSWTSLASAVEFPNPSELDAAHEPQIVDVDLALANSAHPFGSLLEGSGRLVVKARLLPAVLDFKPAMFGKTRTYAGSLAMNGNPEVFRVEVSVDSLSEAEEAKAENDAVFLELSSALTEHGWSTRGLIARGYGEDSFTRIGTFKYRTNHGEGRRETESLEAWMKRFDLELNWFGTVKTEIYDIV